MAQQGQETSQQPREDQDQEPSAGQADTDAPSRQTLEAVLVADVAVVVAPQPPPVVVVRPSGVKPVLVPAGRSFWHRACSLRAVGFLAMYVLLAIAGVALAVSKTHMGVPVLTVGPTMVILTFFYLRYRFSAMKRQIAITFVEAIFWMVPLVVLVSFIDTWNATLTSPQVQIQCALPASAGMGILLELSFVAQCSQWAANETRNTPLVSDGGSACIKLKSQKAGTTQVLVAGDGSMPAIVLKTLLSQEAVAEFSEQQGPVLRPCPTLKDALADVEDTGRVRVASVRQDGRSIRTESRSALASASEYICSDMSCEGSVGFTFVLRPATVANALVTSYFRAGFLEELLKYFAVRRILFKDRVVDVGGLIVYGLAAGAGFATAENIQYTIIGGLDVAISRMLFSIPLHCCTGLIIGIHMGYRKFLGTAFPCLLTLLIPVLVHGSYDFVLMVPPSAGLPQYASIVIVIGILIGAFTYCRCKWLRLEDVCLVDVRALLAAGLISSPLCLCCECDCCVPLYVHKDPMVPTTLGRARAPSTVDQQPSCTRRSSSLRSAPGSIARIARTVSSEIIPSLPPCQTEEVACPGCSADVRAHTSFPSFCPHCGASMTNVVPRAPIVV